jgi:hypothetical protein
VWSEPINSTISTAAAFAVSGHPLTAHTFVDSTNTFLTTSTAFVNGETARTLAYTQPATNKVQDLAGNLLANITAASITNNVAASSGVLSAATFAAASTDLTASTAPAFADYIIPDHQRDGFTLNVNTRKYNANLLTFARVGVNTFDTLYGPLSGTLSGTDGDDTPAHSPLVAWSIDYSNGFQVVSDGAQVGFTVTAPAVSSFTRKVRLYLASFGNWHVVATLSDDPTHPLDITLPTSDVWLGEISFRSSSSTATLTLNFQKPSAGADMGAASYSIQAITLQTA